MTVSDVSELENKTIKVGSFTASPCQILHKVALKLFTNFTSKSLERAHLNIQYHYDPSSEAAQILFLLSVSHTVHLEKSVTDKTDGHRAAYQRSRGDVAFGTGDYAVSRAVCLWLCRKNKQSAKLVLGNNGERCHLVVVVKWVVTV